MLQRGYYAARCHDLAPNPPPQAGGKERGHLLGAFSAGYRKSPAHVFASTSFDQLQDGVGGNSPIQLPQLLHHGLFEGELDSRGEPLDAFGR